MNAKNIIHMISESFQRVPISVKGRFRQENGAEHHCRITAMSPGDAIIITEQPGCPGERIIAYIDHIGPIEGTVLAIEANGFVMSVNASEQRRDKLASQLTWLANQHEPGLPEDRIHERFMPRNPVWTLSTPDGAKHQCHIINLSVSGAALRCDVRPEIGMEVSLGPIRAHVVRHLSNGIAINFVTLQDRSTLTENF